MPDGETTVTVDIAEMQGIFFNLLDNALFWLERVPAGQRRLRIEVERQTSELQILSYQTVDQAFPTSIAIRSLNHTSHFGPKALD